ncbi:Uncharacterised protein [Mycobacteroides abscessus subsp. abscessus]|nr:Uncharacterised protein [Mycobacteroides abscessus subsp. abscessus]
MLAGESVQNGRNVVVGEAGQVFRRLGQLARVDQVVDVVGGNSGACHLKNLNAKAGIRPGQQRW